jgi:hypothetical protein
MEENRVCDGGEYTKLTWPNFYTTSKFINMYSGCFEWKRTYTKLTCTKLTRANFYETSKVIHMYSGCFEWKRTGVFKQGPSDLFPHLKDLVIVLIVVKNMDSAIHPKLDTHPNFIGFQTDVQVRHNQLDKTHSQNDSAFKAPRTATDIIGKYPNFAGFRCWIRRVSLLNVSEYTLNMSVSIKSDMRSFSLSDNP